MQEEQDKEKVKLIWKEDEKIAENNNFKKNKKR